MSETTGRSHASRQPDGGGAGQPANPEMLLLADDDAGAEKADAGEDTLGDAACRVGELAGGGGLVRHRPREGSAQPDKPEVFQADRLAVQVAVQPDQAAGQRRDTKTQDDFVPVKQFAR